MSRLVTLAPVLFAILVVACSSSSPAETKSLVIDVSESGDVSEIPWLLAVEVLKEQGYTIQTVDLPTVDPVTVMAMEKGDLDIAIVSNQLAWSAVDKGAGLVTFLDVARNEFLLAARKEVRTCADLQGRSVALPAVSSVTGAMLDAYIKGDCPDAEPEFLVVPGSNNRVASLLSGEVDAAIVDLQDLADLEGEEPGAYHALVVFADKFPLLQTNGYVTRREFAEQNGEVVKEVIRTVFAARRTLQDPRVLSEAIVDYLDVEADRAQRLADIYLAQGIWDVSGTYTLETVRVNLDFLQEYGDLAPGLEARDVADLSYYEAALDEIGRE